MIGFLLTSWILAPVNETNSIFWKLIQLKYLPLGIQQLVLMGVVEFGSNCAVTVTTTELFWELLYSILDDHLPAWKM